MLFVLSFSSVKSGTIARGKTGLKIVNVVRAKLE